MRQLPLLGFPRFIANKLFRTFFFALHILLWVNLTYPSQKENSNCYALHSTTVNVLRCLILPCITLARVSPIYKSGDGKERRNYRFYLLSIIAKLFEKLVCSQLNLFLTENDILTSCQSGFWKVIQLYNGSFRKCCFMVTEYGCRDDKRCPFPWSIHSIWHSWS